MQTFGVGDRSAHVISHQAIVECVIFTGGVGQHPAV